MKTCPHCNTIFPDRENKCPGCGTFYWEPGKEPPSSSDENEDKNGCSVLLILPLAVGIMVTAILILLGFFSHLLIHFESNQMKIVWIGISAALGYVIFRLLNKLKRKLNK